MLTYLSLGLLLGSGFLFYLSADERDRSGQVFNNPGLADDLKAGAKSSQAFAFGFLAIAILIFTFDQFRPATSPAEQPGEGIEAPGR
jgi:hypothetical protein